MTRTAVALTVCPLQLAQEAIAAYRHLLLVDPTSAECADARREAEAAIAEADGFDGTDGLWAELEAPVSAAERSGLRVVSSVPLRPPLDASLLRVIAAIDGDELAYAELALLVAAIDRAAARMEV